MRLLLVGLLISVGALLFVAGAVTRHILRLRRVQANARSGRNAGGESELPELPSELEQPSEDTEPVMVPDSGTDQI